MFGLKTVAVALCLALGSASAVPTVNARDLTISSVVGEVVCPKGQTLFTVENKVTVPNTKASAVWKYLGNFCDVSWQGFTLIGTTGQCNTPKSTRTFSTLGLTLTERLDLNVGSSSEPAAWQPVFAQAFTLLGNPQVAGTSVTNVHDLLTLTQVGSGSFVDWNLVGCANVTATAQAVFSAVHGGALAGTVAHFA